MEKICKNCKMYIPNTKYKYTTNVDERYKCLAPTLEAQEHRFDYMKPEGKCIHLSYFVKIKEV